MKKISAPKINIRDIIDMIIAKLKIIVTILSILVITGFGFFLYRDFYLTIISAKEIVILKNEVAATAINANALESIIQKQEQKQSLPIRDWSGLETIFTKDINTLPKNNTSDSNPTRTSIKPKTSF